MLFKDRSWNLRPYCMHMLNYLQCQVCILSSTDLFWDGTNAQCSKLKDGKMKTGIKIQMSESYLVTSPRPDMICFTPAPADRQHIDHTVRNQGPFLFPGLKAWLCELRQGSVRLFLLLCSTTYSKQPLRSLFEESNFASTAWALRSLLKESNLWFVQSSASVLSSPGTRRGCSSMDDCLRNWDTSNEALQRWTILP